jgi:hypothetical protein
VWMWLFSVCMQKETKCEPAKRELIIRFMNLFSVIQLKQRTGIN